MYFEQEQQVIKSKTVKMPSIFICIPKLLTNDKTDKTKYDACHYLSGRIQIILNVTFKILNEITF